jgi:hypothetical protein
MQQESCEVPETLWLNPLHKAVSALNRAGRFL